MIGEATLERREIGALMRGIRSRRHHLKKNLLYFFAVGTEYCWRFPKILIDASGLQIVPPAFESKLIVHVSGIFSVSKVILTKLISSVSSFASLSRMLLKQLVFWQCLKLRFVTYTWLVLSFSHGPPKWGRDWRHTKTFFFSDFIYLFIYFKQLVKTAALRKIQMPLLPLGFWSSNLFILNSLI